MLDITRLKEAIMRFGSKERILKEFVDFVEEEQAKNKKSGVISMAQRDAARRLKEIQKNQEEKKVLSPEEDFANLNK